MPHNTMYAYDDQYNVILKNTTKQSHNNSCVLTDFAAIDYFQFDFTELELHDSWKVVHNARVNRCFIPHSTDVARLENLSWRRWTKVKYNLKEVSPESVDWYKDCDVTWLYGPMVRNEQSACNFGFAKPETTTQEDATQLATPVTRTNSLSSLTSTSTLDSDVLFSDEEEEEEEEEECDDCSIKPILKHRYSRGPFGLEGLRRSSESFNDGVNLKKSVSFATMVEIRQF